MRKVILYTDGACSNNPGCGGWAYLFFLKDKPENKIFGNGGEANTTNQRMEMMGFLGGVKMIFRNLTNEYESTHIKVYTDSAYLANGINQKWYEKWQQNGWRTSKNEPVKNQDLWSEIINLIISPYINLEVFKVKGHSGDKLNDQVDALAKEGMSAFKGGK